MKSNSNTNSLFPFEAALGFTDFGISVFPELDGSSEGFSLMLLFLLQKILYILESIVKHSEAAALSSFTAEVA